MGTTRCESGRYTGHLCDAAAAVVVEIMPIDLRDRHESARNRGLYPMNGAERLDCCNGCAAQLVAGNGDWAAIVRPARPRPDLRRLTVADVQSEHVAALARDADADGDHALAQRAREALGGRGGTAALDELLTEINRRRTGGQE